MADPRAVVAEAIYGALHAIGLKSRPWADLNASERAGWLGIAENVISKYERAVREATNA